MSDMLILQSENPNDEDESNNKKRNKKKGKNKNRKRKNKDTDSVTEGNKVFQTIFSLKSFRSMKILSQRNLSCQTRTLKSERMTLSSRIVMLRKT